MCAAKGGAREVGDVGVGGQYGWCRMDGWYRRCRMGSREARRIVTWKASQATRVEECMQRSVSCSAHAVSGAVRSQQRAVGNSRWRIIDGV
jgi:hypothetical protein